MGGFFISKRSAVIPNKKEKRLDNSILRPSRKARQQYPQKATHLCLERIDWLDEANCGGAQVILEDLGRSGGLYAGLVRWAGVATAQVSNEQRVLVLDVKGGVHKRCARGRKS